MGFGNAGLGFAVWFGFTLISVESQGLSPTKHPLRVCLGAKSFYSWPTVTKSHQLKSKPKQARGLLLAPSEGYQHIRVQLLSEHMLIVEGGLMTICFSGRGVMLFAYWKRKAASYWISLIEVTEPSRTLGNRKEQDLDRVQTIRKECICG